MKIFRTLSDRFRCATLLGFLVRCLSAHAEVTEVHPMFSEKDGVVRVEYRAGETLVGRATDAAPAGVELLLPGAAAVPVRFPTHTKRAGGFELGPVKLGALTLRMRIVQRTPALVERTLEVTADAAQKFSVTFPLEFALDGEFASYSGPEKARVIYDTGVRERRFCVVELSTHRVRQFRVLLQNLQVQLIGPPVGIGARASHGGFESGVGEWGISFP